MLHRLTQEMLSYQDGQLQDDATLVLIEWETGGERRLLPDASAPDQTA